MSSEPLIVVGSGIAGLSVALSAAPRPVLLLGRAIDGADSASRLAQGGIAAALAPGDSAAEHYADTLSCGAGLNDANAVRYLTEQAAAAIAWLQRNGVVFDGDGSGPHFAREGGHRRARVLHVGGDASGAGLLRALQAAAHRAAHIEWRQEVIAEALLTRGEHVVGVGMRDGEHYWHKQPGAAVGLATGGIGGLFAATSNPAGAQGMGLALARAVGAPLRDLELLQFHPTGLSLGNSTGPTRPLVTEALRGAGAVLRDQHGQAVMRGVHAMADLAPRDVVSRRLWHLQQLGRQVVLDARDLAIDWPRQFPTVLAACRSAGIDPRRMSIPVTPVAHFHMGGIAVDLDGASAVPGLYAAGEVAGTGVHGGNRLGSNALLEAVVFGRRLGQGLADADLSGAASAPMAMACLLPSATRTELDALRALLWCGLGPVRDGAGLQRAAAEIQGRSALAECWQGGLAGALIDAALAQPRSRGAHYRSDAPALAGAAACAERCAVS